MQMKIAIIHGFVGGGGGIEKTLLATIEGLVEKNHIVNLYTVSRPMIQIRGILIHSILPFSLPFFGLYQRLMESNLVKKAGDDDIIIQVSSGPTLPSRPDQPMIIYCHDDFRNEAERTITKYKGIWSWYYRPYYMLAQKFTNQIKNKNIYLIANSGFIQELLKNRFGKTSTVIYPPVELNKFDKASTKENKVVTISRYSQEKNLEFAIDVMNDIKTNYVIIGNTKTRSNEIYYSDLLKRIQHQKKYMRLLKNIERNNVIEELIKSKVYFHPSPETFGISIIESIAAGCIPIVPDNSAHKETVPVEELRYKQDSLIDAQEKIKKALSGDYDKFIEPLQRSITKYSKENFKKEIVNYIETLG